MIMRVQSNTTRPSICSEMNTLKNAGDRLLRLLSKRVLHDHIVMAERKVCAIGDSTVAVTKFDALAANLQDGTTSVYTIVKMRVKMYATACPRRMHC